MTPKETALAFVDAINAHNVDQLGKLMTDDHKFVDPHGDEVACREQMLAGWRGYFAWFPDYQIEVNEIFEGQREFAMSGFAEWVIQRRSGSQMASACGLESIVREGRIALWQAVADTKLPFESMSGS